MIRTQVQLTEHQMKALRRVSAATGQSIADLVRQGVDRLLAAQPGISREERIQRAMRVAGKFKSGSSDVSTHHDRYLAEAYDDHLR
jgi:ribbon-helix-helix protein